MIKYWSRVSLGEAEVTRTQVIPFRRCEPFSNSLPSLASQAQPSPSLGNSSSSPSPQKLDWIPPSLKTAWGSSSDRRRVHSPLLPNRRGHLGISRSTQVAMHAQISLCGLNCYILVGLVLFVRRLALLFSFVFVSNSCQKSPGILQRNTKIRNEMSLTHNNPKYLEWNLA